MSSRLVAGLTLNLAAAVVFAACSGTSATPRPTELTILAAASLGSVLDDVEAAWEASRPGTVLTVSTDSSGALATQIEQGSPADVFLSADTENPQRLVDGGFTDGRAVIFAGNRLTIITPDDNPARLMAPLDLAADGVRIVAAGDHVPISRYAAQLVRNLAAAPDAPAGFASGYAANIVSKEDNVGAVRTKIELGEGDAAIVYVTDALASNRVATLDVPDSVNVTAAYAGVVLKASGNVEGARAFLDWLAGAEGQAILAGPGFLPPPP